MNEEQFKRNYKRAVDQMKTNDQMRKRMENISNVQQHKQNASASLFTLQRVLSLLPASDWLRRAYGSSGTVRHNRGHKWQQ